jgi:Cu-processing system permease protein
MTPRSYGSLWWLFAQQELTLAARSRWIQTFTVVFAALALAVASAGYVLSGGSGLQDFARTSASLVQLVLLLVPMTALLFGVMTVTPDAGTAELLFSQPVSRRTILTGKLLGLFLALIASQAVGFGAAGLVLFFRAGEDGLTGFLGVAAGSVVLTAIFLSVAAAISAGGTSAHRARHLAGALVVWFLTVVLFDIGALGAASLLPSGPASRLLIVSALINPVDAARTGTLLLVEGTTAFGSASIAFLRVVGGIGGAALWLSISGAAWIALPLVIATRRITRADV